MDALEVKPSRKTSPLVWILIGVPVLFVLWSLSLSGVRNGLQKSPITSALNSVRQISLALDSYAKDKKALDDVDVFYPPRLESLVEANYLSQQEFEKLTKQNPISYFPPTTREAAPNHILLISHVKDRVIYGFLSGEIRIDINK